MRPVRMCAEYRPATRSASRPRARTRGVCICSLSCLLYARPAPCVVCIYVCTQVCTHIYTHTHTCTSRLLPIKLSCTRRSLARSRQRWRESTTPPTQRPSNPRPCSSSSSCSLLRMYATGARTNALARSRLPARPPPPPRFACAHRTAPLSIYLSISLSGSIARRCYALGGRNTSITRCRLGRAALV